ncbi:hypothetical protein ACFPRL_24400 [Pseudoclavibacter helvolus]
MTRSTRSMLTTRSRVAASWPTRLSGTSRPSPDPNSPNAASCTVSCWKPSRVRCCWLVHPVSTRQRRSSTRRWSSTPTWRAWRSRSASPDVDNSVRQEAGCSRSSPPLSMRLGTYAVSESTYSWFSEIHCSTMGP